MQVTYYPQDQDQVLRVPRILPAGISCLIMRANMDPAPTNQKEAQDHSEKTRVSNPIKHGHGYAHVHLTGGLPGACLVPLVDYSDFPTTDGHLLLYVLSVVPVPFRPLEETRRPYGGRFNEI